MCQEAPYPCILPQAEDWPIVHFDAQRAVFLQAVIANASQEILAQCRGTHALQEVLRETLQQEKGCRLNTPWRADPADEAVFWEQVARDLQSPHAAQDVLNRVVTRYAYGIAGRFSVKHFEWASRGAMRFLAHVLSPAGLGHATGWLNVQRVLQQRIHVTGNIDHLRKLAQGGTLFMVPTHFSHLDSLLICYANHFMGLPPLLYCAGLNLLNNPLFAYLMSDLGVYKVDRRKKSLPYLTTLKAYSRTVLQQGCHTLLFPGGTRSRSGAPENTLKLGLLGTAIEAQRESCKQYGPQARKIFVVPVVINSPFVLEAPSLIQEYMAKHHVPSCPGAGRSGKPSWYKQLRAAMNTWLRGANVSISLGPAMDVLGHAVDETGQGYSPRGALVNVDTYFCDDDTDVCSKQQDRAHTQRLGQEIVKAYHRYNCIFASHLVAFAAFELMQKAHDASSSSTTVPLQCSADAVALSYAALERCFGRLHAAVQQLYRADKVQLEECLKQGSITDMIQRGIETMGVYHIRRPLLRTKTGDVVSQDLSTLFYYHNRITGYGLEAYV